MASHAFFYWLLNMSLTATLTGSVVLLCRHIPRLPRRLVILMWLVPLFRMWCPVGMGWDYSLMSFISRFTTRTVRMTTSVPDISVTSTNTVMLAQSYSPVTYIETAWVAPSWSTLFTVAFWVWLIVAVLLILTFSLLYLTTLRDLSDATHIRDNVYWSEKVTSPAVYGILRPRILLPAACPEQDQPMILLHESTHIRRRDNLWRSLALLTAAIHWFNPASWLFLGRFLSDLELACDEAVLASPACRENKDRSRDYALTLLSCARTRSLLFSPFGGARIQVRIRHILSYRKLSWVSWVFLSLLTLAIIFTLLTNAV